MLNVRAQGEASGKLILFGEHAVVHGGSAIAAGIGLGCHALVERVAGPSTLRLLERPCTAGDGTELGRALQALLEEGGASGGLAISVTGELPPGMGLGFSATAAVAIARAVEALAGRVQPGPVWRRAMAWEGVFHGSPSGIDVAAAMRGGCMRFAKGEDAAPLPLARPLRLCVGLSGTASSTREMVARASALQTREPARFSELMARIGQVVAEGQGALLAGRDPEIGVLMDRNHEALVQLAVSSPALDALCLTARRAGALGAKLTGAGGGGAMVALAGSGAAAASIAEQILAVWRGLGYRGFMTEVMQPC